MGQQGKEPNPLGQAKSITFGAVLRSAIKKEYGTSEEFRLSLGISPGRVSHLLSGAESLTAQTLSKVLDAFPNLADQNRLHEAWVNTFAPSPLEELSNREIEESAHQLLAVQSELMLAGKAREVLKSLELLRTRVKEPLSRFRILRATTEVAMFLDRSTLGLEASEELTRLAIQCQEPEWIARALLLRATAHRNSSKMNLRTVAEAHDRAAEFNTAWNPSNPSERLLAGQIADAVVRDRILFLLKLNEKKPVDRKQLKLVLAKLERSLEGDMTADTKALTIEVKGRVHLSLGEILAAEESVEEAREQRGFVSFDHVIKTAILEAQLLRERGIPDKAVFLTRSALEECWEVDNLHHARSLESQLTN